MSWTATAPPQVRTFELLLVADRIHNSGKLMLDDTATLDTQGFHAVYVFPYPEHVRVFGEKFDAA